MTAGLSAAQEAEIDRHLTGIRSIIAAQPRGVQALAIGWLRGRVNEWLTFEVRSAALSGKLTRLPPLRVQNQIDQAISPRRRLWPPPSRPPR